MTLWARIKCHLFGACPTTTPNTETQELTIAMRESVAETAQMKNQVKQIKASGIWPQDLMRGTYRVNRRTVRHDQRS